MEEKKCKECQLCRKMLVASIRQAISEFERCLKLKQTRSLEVRGALVSLKDSLSICDISPCNYLQKKIEKTFLSKDGLASTSGEFSPQERAAISIFTAELNAFIGEDESAVADESTDESTE